MRVAISQSNYIPWAGFFGLISQSDVFVFLDDVQFTSRDWRSRNRIKTSKGLKWLSVPVGDSLSRRVCDVQLPTHEWKDGHRSSILSAYSGSRNFQAGADLVDRIYSDCQSETLSNFNQYWIKYIAHEVIGLECTFVDSREVNHEGKGSDRVLSICKSLSATEYISGPSAAAYLEVKDFSTNDIEVLFADYSKMRPYEQLHGDFVPSVSVIDMVFNVRSGYSQLVEIDTFRP
jgi:hypothetical protein